MKGMKRTGGIVSLHVGGVTIKLTLYVAVLVTLMT